MLIKRDKYLNRLINHKGNKRVKIITGIRRCGKSYLLNEIFKNHLIEAGVDEEHIIQIALDDRKNIALRNPDACYDYVSNRIDESDKSIYYILIDEVQMMSDFADVLNGFLHIRNADVYVTGSNSKFLSKDIATEFRGRGDEIKMYPLSFSEFSNAYLQQQKEKWEAENGDLMSLAGISMDEAWNEYYTYGGLPYILELNTNEEKADYLNNLFAETYIKDIVDRNNVANDVELDTLVDVIASGIGALTNPQKLADTFTSNGSSISAPTIKKYLEYLKDAFIISEAKRYDVKGRKYIGTPVKYYFEDIGLRNARLNFRQQEQTHIMENVIYNELRVRGYSVDVGVIEIREQDGETRTKKKIEIDFIVNEGSKRYYIQSAYMLPDDEKRNQEMRPLRKVGDSFKKIVIVRDNVNVSRDEDGIVTMGLIRFLTDPNSLDL